MLKKRFLLQMLMPKKNRIAIYELLFKEGVMVAKKDVHMPKHPELADKNVPNLHVMKAMQVAGLGMPRVLLDRETVLAGKEVGLPVLSAVWVFFTVPAGFGLGWSAPGAPGKSTNPSFYSLSNPGAT